MYRGFGVVQTHAAGEAALGEEAQLRDGDLVDLFGGGRTIVVWLASWSMVCRCHPHLDRAHARVSASQASNTLGMAGKRGIQGSPVPLTAPATAH